MNLDADLSCALGVVLVSAAPALVVRMLAMSKQGSKSKEAFEQRSATQPEQTE